MTQQDTIAAVATAPGRAGIAVVRVSGEGAFAVAEALTGRKAAPGRIRLSRVRGDDCVVLAFRAPHSYTGEDVVEFQCHGGAVAPRRILDACFAAGARLARRGEFTSRAFLNGKIGYEAAEAVIDLIDARTDRAAEAALSGLGGRRSRAFRALYDAAMALSSEIEHSLDVDESDLPDGFRRSLLQRISDLAGEVERELRSVREGRILRSGICVVLAGEPNAGKSSLFNALVGSNRVLVSDVAGTTRDSIEEWLDLEGWPVRLVDTAGLRKTDDAIEGEGVRRAENLIARADLVLCLSDGVKLPEGKRALRIHAKCDLMRRGEGLEVSSVTGEGLDSLRAALVREFEDLAGDALEAAGPDGADGPASVLSLVARDLAEAAAACDMVALGSVVRHAASRLGEFIGADYSNDLLNRLFSRFCVGK